jgi:type I restriction enzyme, S subunit
MSEWKEVFFSDFVQINPTVSLKGLVEASFVEMKDLNDGIRYCYPSSIRKISGGARFEEYDTLFARITPCLENGKIAQVKGLRNHIGFGSTEFLVFRGKKKVSDNDFVYYLSRWKDVRDHAEINLDGTSGRQRVPKDCFKELILTLPTSLPEQKAIASVLSSLDDKIDLLHRQNATLEKMAETLFRQWFVEEAKEEWEMVKVSDLTIHYKDSINPQKHISSQFYHYSIPAFDNGKEPTIQLGNEIQSNKYCVIQNSILFSKLNPHKDKRIWLINEDVEKNSVCSTEFQVVLPKKVKHLYFLYGWLSYKENYNEIASGVGGTSGSHQRISPNVIFDFQCPLISDEFIDRYNVLVTPIFLKQKSNQQQIRTLTTLRNTLLPKLMSGEVRIKSHSDATLVTAKQQKQTAP